MIRPLKAWYPALNLIQRFVSVPYDVISRKEASEIITENPDSFLRIVRPDAVVGDDEIEQLNYSVNAFNDLKNETLRSLDVEKYFCYRIKKGSHEQTGLFALVSVSDYEHGRIVRHEKTKPDKVRERAQLIQEMSAHAEAVMMAFEDVGSVVDLLMDEAKGSPWTSVRFGDELHEIFMVSNQELLQQFFEHVPRLYITDGHHRCESAMAAAAAMPSNEGAKYFSAVLFPFSQVRILSYYRTLSGLQREDVERMYQTFEVQEAKSELPKPSWVNVFNAEKGWKSLRLRTIEAKKAASKLDYDKLQKQVFAEIFGVIDPRSDSRLDFVGGSRGVKELERRVSTGEADLAFVLNPVSMDELKSVGDAGELMPPKSTWFDPKVLSGIFIHEF